MAFYFTDAQKDQIRSWLLELRELVNPTEFPNDRDRAHELVNRLDQFKYEPYSIIADEFERVRRLWRRLEANSE